MAEAGGAIIRPAHAGDVRAILEISNDAILNSTAMYEYAARSPEMQAAWLAEKQAAGWPVLVIEGEAGDVAGFGSLGPFRPRAAYGRTTEHSVYVARAYRGRGFGRRLLEALMDAARGKGFHVMVGGVDSENSASLAFHRALGFQEVGRLPQIGWKFERWLTLVFMHRIIDEA